MTLMADGKWVEDDYDEQAATVKCQEGGFTPGTIVQDEEVVQHTTSVVRQEYRGEGGRAANLVPFYSIGGSTTQFGGNGADPLSEAGWGNKRAKFKTLGVTEEDWMLRTAEETRRIDAQLREYREERLVPLEGGDLKGWVYTTENLSEGKEDQGVEEVSMAVPDINVVKEDQDDAAPSSPSAIKEDEEALTPLPLSSLQGNDVEMAEVEKDGADEVAVEDGVERTIGGRIVVETEENARRRASKYNWGLGSWQAGEVRASYEVSSDFAFGMTELTFSLIRTSLISLCIRNLNRLCETDYRITLYWHRTPIRNTKTLFRAQSLVQLLEV